MADRANPNGGRVSLASVVGGLTAALVRAQDLGDREVESLKGSRGESLATLGVRTFEIADVTVELKCAIEGPTVGGDDLNIAVGSSALRGLEERHLSTVRLRFAASPVRVVSVSTEEDAPKAAPKKVPDEA